MHPDQVSLTSKTWDVQAINESSAKIYTIFVQLDWTPITRTRKINLSANRKSYDESETIIGKLSVMGIQICLVQFVKVILTSVFKITLKHCPNITGPSRIIFVSLNTIVSRSQVLLRCLGLLANCFFNHLRKSSLSACAR